MGVGKVLDYGGRAPRPPARYYAWVIGVRPSARRRRIGLLFALPAGLVVAFLIAYPVYLTFKLSVSAVQLPSFAATFVGLRNVRHLVDDPGFWVALKNTAVWAVATTGLEFGLGLGAALVLNRRFRGRRLFRLLIFLPWTVPKIVAANTWAWMFHGDYGIINATLRSWGLGAWAHVWLGEPATALGAVIVAEVWQGYGFVMLMLLAGLQAIPDDLLAAGKVDGAGALQMFRFIVLPCLRPVMVLVLLLVLIQSVNAFIMIYTMTGGGPAGMTETLGLYIYRLSFQFFRFEVASAAGVLLLGCAFLVTFLYVKALGARETAA
jgi:multiple sugar transport system permease protein